jgi:hypothetical protein
MAETDVLNAQKFSFSLDNNFATGSIQIDPASHPELLVAGPLPDSDIVLGGADLQVAPGQDIKVGPASVGFSADANASLALFTTKGALRDGLLKEPSVISQIGDNLVLPDGDKFLMLRWGYDISGTASGAVALAAGTNLEFSASADTKGYFAVAKGILNGPTQNALASVTDLISTWKLPSQVDDISKMPERTTLISEVDGSFQLGSKVTFGYDFNWVRAVDGLGLKGDVGLKLKAGLEASIGFGMTGKYAVLLSRATDAPAIRMRLYKLRVRELDLGFSASLSATPVTPADLPASLDDLLKAITGTHQQQIVKLLGDVRDWTDPSKPIFGPLVGLADAEAQKLIQSITGVTDLAGAFDDVKARIQKLFDLWDQLPQTATELLWSKLPDQQQIAAVKDIAQKVSTFSEADLSQFVQSKLGDVQFFNSPEGQALESLAVDGLFSAIQNTPELAKVKQGAGLVAGILDGSEVQTLLTNLQNAVNTRLDLKKIETIVDQASFDSLDTWLKARLENFLETKLVGAQGVAEIQKLRDGIHTILGKAESLYTRSLAALKQTYDFSLNATYQSTSTSSALLDVNFDFAVPGSQAGAGLKLALGGRFDQLLASSMAGVTINEGVLAVALHKESHVSISLPFFSTRNTSVNDAVARLQLSQEAGGLVFSLDAVDRYTSNNDYSSALTIALAAPGTQNMVNVYAPTAAWRYALKVGSPNLTSSGLTDQYTAYGNAYFAQELRTAGFAGWVNTIAPANGQFGNTLLTLSVTLPSSAASAWMKAPDNPGDPLYKRMSIALQAQLRQVLHDVRFGSIGGYRDVAEALSLLVFCSIPPFPDATLNGDDVQFLGETAPGDTIYWYLNHTETEQNKLLPKILFSGATQRNLHQKLRLAQSRLKDAGDPDGVSKDYADDPASFGRTLAAVLQGPHLDPLFRFEGGMVEEARAAGLKMAAFRKNQFANPVQARQDLASFGQKLSDDFNEKLEVFAVDTALMPLGTAIYAAGAAVLSPGADTSAAAMFTVAMLKAGVSTLDPADADILRAERVVHGSML